MKTEAQAWRECAEWCAVSVERKFLCVHLLHAIGGSMWYGNPDLDLPGGWPYQAMMDRLDAHADLADKDGDDAGVLDSPKRNDARVIFCLLMAIECTEDA